MANLQSLVNHNSNLQQKDQIFKDLVDSFTKLRINEQEKPDKNETIVQFCRETANTLQKNRKKYGNAEIEELTTQWANYKVPPLDELEASQLAETTIKLVTDQQNRRQTARQNVEFETDFPEPVPQDAEGQHQQVYVSHKSDLINPQTYPFAVQHMYTAKDFIITKGDLKFYSDPIQPGNTPRLLRYSGNLDMDEIMTNILIYDKIIDQVDVLTTLQRMIKLGEKRGYCKDEHLSLLMRHILKLHYDNIFTTYSATYDPEQLFETLKGLHRPFETRNKIDKAIKELVRKPNETISSIASRLETLNVKKFKLETNTSNPIERAKRAAQIQILNFVTNPVKAEIENYVKAKTSFGENPTLNEILELIETLESNAANRPTSDLMITDMVKHSFVVQTRGNRTDYHIPSLQDRAQRTRYSSRNRYDERNRTPPRAQRRESLDRNYRRGRQMSRSNDRYRQSYSRSASPYQRRSNSRYSNSRSRERSQYRQNNSRPRFRRNYLSEKEREIMRKVRNDDKNKDINCIRCFSRNHDTTQCRRYIDTSMYMCICEEGYHYRDKCLTRKDSRRNSIEDNYRNRTQSRQRQNSSDRYNAKERQTRDSSRENRRQNWQNDTQRYRNDKSHSPKQKTLYRHRSPSSSSRH